MADEHQLRLYLLGRFELVAGDRVLLDASWNRSRAKSLIKLLALQSTRSLTRDQVLDTLWPDLDPDAASNNLHKNLYYLRSYLKDAGSVVTLASGMLSLSTEVWIDVVALRELATVARHSREIADYDTALALYAGDLLPDDLYEPWTEEPRQSMRSLRNELVLDSGRRLARLGRTDEAERRLRMACDADPLSERASRELMQLYADTGRRDHALREYERISRAVHDEFGVEPEIGLSSVLEEAAGDRAVKGRFWDEALRCYEKAMEEAARSGAHDVRMGILQLKIADVRATFGDTLSAADDYKRASDLAERARAYELQARALLGYQHYANAIPQNRSGQREAHELIERALLRLPQEDSVARALLLATSSLPAAAAKKPGVEVFETGRAAFSGQRDETVELRLREAAAMARRLNNTGVLMVCLQKLRTYIVAPETIDERLGLSREMCTLAGHLGLLKFESSAIVTLHEDLMESGDLEGARIEARQMYRLGQSAKSPLDRGQGAGMLAAHATADGDLTEAKQCMFDAKDAAAEAGGNSNANDRFALQMFILRFHQGRLEKLEPAYRLAVDRYPSITRMRIQLAFIYAEADRVADATEQYQLLVKQETLPLPRNYMWWLHSHNMARVAIKIGDQAGAARLYEALLPYAHLNAIVANSASLGSASLILGELATMLSSLDDAQAHYDAALEFNSRTRQRSWVAHTRLRYAEFLLRRNAGEDAVRASQLLRLAQADADEIGMQKVAATCSALLASSARAQESALGRR